VNRRLVLCLILAVLTAATSAGLFLLSGGGWLAALAIYMAVGSTSLLALAIAAAWIGERQPLRRAPRRMVGPAMAPATLTARSG
jgi:hypothetical protein